MTKIKAALAALRKKAAQVWEREPATVLSAGTSALIGIAAAFGITLSSSTVGLALELAIPLVLGRAIREVVTSPATTRKLTAALVRARGRS